MKKHVVIGTAGHIDHGKTSLIRAITGRDLDVLDEEKRRGITIELGFAFYGDQAAFVDVPGHEKLVKTMVAGASAMRAAMLVVAGDDGVMPQTREHLAVLDAMGIDNGVVAVTKADLVDDPDWLDLVVEEIRELLEPTSLSGSPVIVVDSLSGRGIQTLREELDKLIKSVESPEETGYFRMPVDRSFLIKGHGRVVTGSVWCGTAKANDKLVLLPGGTDVRVRGVQAHEKPVDEVGTGDRAALNVSLDGDPERGDMILSFGRAVASDFFDVEVTLLPGNRIVNHRTRVRVHVGTAEVIGRVLTVTGNEILPGNRAMARISLEGELTLMQGDRGVIRLYSPVETLGGIRVLDPSPPDRRRTIKGLHERLEGMAAGGDGMVEAYVRSRGVMEYRDLVRILPLTNEKTDEILLKCCESGAVQELRASERWYVDGELWREWSEASQGVLAEYHQQYPDEAGLAKAAWAGRVIVRDVSSEVIDALIAGLEAKKLIVRRGGALALPGHEVSLKKEDVADAERVCELLKASGLQVPLPSALAEELNLPEDRVRNLLRSLKLVGRAVILDQKVIIAADILEGALEQMQEAFGEREFVLTEVNELLGISRKYGVPILEYLDKEGVTVRDGDTRRLA